MAFDAYDRSLDLIRVLRPIVRKLASHDPTLTKQLRDAASGIVQTLAEGAERRGRDRKHLFRTALGSASEVRGSLDLAVAWGYLDGAEISEALELAGRIKAMAFGLSR